MNSLCQWFITTSKSISKQSDSSSIEGLCAESSENPPHKMFPQEIETESINLLKMSNCWHQTATRDEKGNKILNLSLVRSSTGGKTKGSLKVKFYVRFSYKSIESHLLSWFCLGPADTTGLKGLCLHHSFKQLWVDLIKSNHWVDFFFPFHDFIGDVKFSQFHKGCGDNTTTMEMRRGKGSIS